MRIILSLLCLVSFLSVLSTATSSGVGSGDRTDSIFYLVVISCSNLSDTQVTWTPLFNLIGVNPSNGSLLEDTLISLQLPTNYTDKFGDCKNFLTEEAGLAQTWEGSTPLDTASGEILVDLTDLKPPEDPFDYGYYLSFNVKEKSNSSVIKFPLSSKYSPFFWVENPV